MDGKTLENTRIDSVQTVWLCNRKVKLFKAYRYSPIAGGFLFDGKYCAPIKTANSKLHGLYVNGEYLRRVTR